MTGLVEPNLKDPDRAQGTQKQRHTRFLRDFEDAKPIVSARSKGWCEVDGCDRYAVVFHHRAGRKGTGVNHPDMILHCCDSCHRAIHASPSMSFALGYMVRRT